MKQKRFRNAKDGTNGKTYHISPDDMEFVFDDEGKKEYIIFIIIRKEKKLLRELEQKKKLEEAIYAMNKEKVFLICNYRPKR